MEIQCRLSNNWSFAIEFSATSAATFAVAVRNAYVAFQQHEDGAPELHVRTDIDRDWIPPNYPDSNAAVRLYRLPDRADAERLWLLVTRARLHGDRFDRELKMLIQGIISDRGCRAVKLELIRGTDI